VAFTTNTAESNFRYTLVGAFAALTLFIVGTTTNACVETSLREAYLRNFDVVAIPDRISGVNLDWEQTAQQIWKQYFCETAESKQVLDWVQEQSAPRTFGYGDMLVMVKDMKRSTDSYVNRVGFKIRPAMPLADGRSFTAFHQGIALVTGRAVRHRQIDHITFEVNDVRKLQDKLKSADVHFSRIFMTGHTG
jgi:ureidoacrylate peracid hydrolase